jgi:hypothetical protein
MDYDECEAVGGMTAKETEVLGENILIATLSPQIPHDQNCTRTRSAAVRRRGLAELWHGLYCLFFELFGYHWRSKNMIRKHTAI